MPTVSATASSIVRAAVLCGLIAGSVPAAAERAITVEEAIRVAREKAPALALARADEVPEPDRVTLARLHRGVMERIDAQERRKQWVMWPALAAAASLAIATAISVARIPAPAGGRKAGFR